MKVIFKQKKNRYLENTGFFKFQFSNYNVNAAESNPP